jgi:HK97 family phage major capsid protein
MARTPVGLARLAVAQRQNTLQLRERAPTFGKFYAYPKASNRALDDIFFSVKDWLTNAVTEHFSKCEGDAVIGGDGSNKLTGMPWLILGRTIRVLDL